MDAVGPAICPHDEFLSLDAAMWRYFDPASPHVVTVDQGDAKVTLVPGVQGYGANGLVARRPIDFTDGTLILVLAEHVDQGGFAEDYVEITVDTLNSVSIGDGGGSINMTARVAGVNNRNTTAFDNASWWRIRHHASAGSMELDRSNDGVTWMPSFTAPFAAPTTSMTVSLMAATYSDGGNPTPGRVRFDRVNVTGPGCP